MAKEKDLNLKYAARFIQTPGVTRARAWCTVPFILYITFYYLFLPIHQRNDHGCQLCNRDRDLADIFLELMTKTLKQREKEVNVYIHDDQLITVP